MTFKIKNNKENVDINFINKKYKLKILYYYNKCLSIEELLTVFTEMGCCDSCLLHLILNTITTLMTGHEILIWSIKKFYSK